MIPMIPDDRDPDASASPEPGANDGSPAPVTGAGPDRPDRADRPDRPDRADRADLPDDGMFGGLPDSVKNRVESWVPELVKKAVAAGMGAVFTTEESIRRLTKEMPMPKEVAGYLVNTASSTKDELFRVVAREIREFLVSVNLSEEVAKMLTTLSLEIKTEIRFIPNDEKYTGVEPDVKARVRLKRNEPRSRRRVFGRRGAREQEPGGPKTGGEGEE
jgi:hypothetical protein